MKEDNRVVEKIFLVFEEAGDKYSIEGEVVFWEMENWQIILREEREEDGKNTDTAMSSRIWESIEENTNWLTKNTLPWWLNHSLNIETKVLKKGDKKRKCEGA